MKKRGRTWFRLVALLLICVAHNTIFAQEGGRLEIVDVDTSAFPEVTITVLASEENGAGIIDPTRLQLQEDGLAITDVTYGNSANGADLVFVIDANEAINVADDETEHTRLDKVRDSVERFATQYMSRNGLDRVSIIVPDENGNEGAFLIQDAQQPEELITAIASYEPSRPGPTPLNAMVSTALSHVQQYVDDPRYRAVLLFTDARRINEQLSYPLLVAQANDASTPLFAAILGAQADETEIANVTRLFEPTNGLYVHMPQPVDSDPIYEVWQEQGNPIGITYRSSQRQSGRNQLLITLGDKQASASFDLELLPPLVSVELDTVEISRSGNRSGSLLEELRPVEIPVVIQVDWQDGLPRQIQEATLLVDGRPLASEAEFLPQGDDRYSLIWDVRDQGESEVTLQAQVTDELGYQNISDPLQVTFTVQQPVSPTQLPATAIVSEPAPAASEEQSASIWPLALLLLLILTLLLALLFWRRRQKQMHVDEANKAFDERLIEKERIEPPAERVPYLEALKETKAAQILLLSENIIIGRDESSVTVKLDDPSISPLHARIRKREQSYWLFDEGSQEGTTLNYKLLGLAPRRLSHDDIVGFGKLLFRFRYRYPIAATSLDSYNYRLAEENDDEFTDKTVESIQDDDNEFTDGS